MEKIRHNLVLRSLTWFVILTQVTSSAAFADIKVISKATLAPKIVSDPTPPTDSDNSETRQDMICEAVLRSMGQLFFNEHRSIAEVQKLVRDEYRGYSPRPGGVFLDTIKPFGKSISVEYNDPDVQRVCIALLYPKDHGSSQSFGIDKRVKGYFKDEQNALSFPAEPLIGHKFSDSDLENISIIPWGQSEAFSKTLDELEEKIKERAPDTVKDRLIKAIMGFKNASEGRKLGVIKSVYESSEKYYLGFGTKKTIGLAAEFFDPRSPLYEHRLEALFHEFFHAEFGRGEEYSVSHDTSAHLLAMQMAAVIFWKDMTDDKVKGLTLEDLESHNKNKFGEKIRSWKIYQQFKLEDVDVPKAMTQKDWKYLLNELRASLKIGWESNRSVSEFLIACDQTAALNKRHPVEARYPIIKAVTYLSKKEKEALITVLMGTECAAIRSLPVVDSILLMLKKEVPSDWLSSQAPKLKNRSTWIVSSEVWNAGGGLGRVEQSHSIGDELLLKQEGSHLKTCEPYYSKTIDKKTGSVIDTDYPVLLGIKSKDLEKAEGSYIKEVDRFEVPVGDSIAVAVCYMAVNKFGIESYLIKGFKKGQAETEAPYYTERLYHYRNEKEPNLVSLAEFAAFLSKASLELTRRVEEKKRADMKDKYRPPVMHFNDGQLGLAPLFRRIYYKNDPILGVGKAMVGYSTHTYPNRCWVSRRTGEDMLRYLDIPQDAWKYFYRHYETIIDLTSAGARTADWYAGVSAKHVDDILSYKYDNWGEWEYLNDTMVSVTNGDIRSATAHVFREIMLELFPDADVEEPTPEQVLATKREAKKRLGLREDQPVVSYSGRVVREKASRGRAFCDENIRKMVIAGIQVVIGANVAANPDMVEHINSFAALEEEIARDKLANPKLYKGSFTLMRNIDIEVQRAILAATDIQIQDSDPNTEAAGYSEADVAACGGLELAPSWTEGILQSQGIPINLDIPGEGNTIIPKDGNPDSYFEAIIGVLEKFPEELAKYQANAVRLSSILEALLTSAEYLRQWNKTIEKMEAAAAVKDQAGQIAPELAGKGSIRNGLETIFNSELKFKTDISVKRDLLPKRMKTPDTVYSLRTVQEEVRILKALGILEDGALPNTFRLRSQIRNLSPPEFEKILSIPELELSTIPQDKIPALRRQIEKFVLDIYKARPKYVTITSRTDFSKEAAAKVADEIRALQRERPDKDVVMVFATGNTMPGFLDELSKAERIDWSRFQAYHLDEYKGLDINHPSSFAYFLNKNLFSKVPIPRGNIHYVSEYVPRFGGDTEKAFAQYLKDMGAPDITMLGVGMDGHLAFNEPPKYSSFDSHMQVVALDESTVDANKADFSALETDPSSRFAYTMGMADIFRSKKIFFLANKPSKAGIVAKAIDGDISEDVPASMLLMHRNVRWILDEDAANRLNKGPALEARSHTAAKDIKGPKAPDSNKVISDLILSDKVFEITIEEGALKAYPIRYIDGYRPGEMNPNKYRGPPADVTKLFNEEESANLMNWLDLHKVNGKPVKFRIVLGEASIGWNDDVEHSSIAHAGYRDGAIYIGEKMLRRLFQRNSEDLCKSILEDDELAHLVGKDHGSDRIYKARLELVGTLIKNIETRELVKSVNIPDFSAVSMRKLIMSAPTIEEYAQSAGVKPIFVKETGRTHYYLGSGIGILDKKFASEEYRIIKHERAFNADGKYTGQIFIYYHNREDASTPEEKDNCITIILEGAMAGLPVSDKYPDVTRNEKQWDRAVIKIYLDGQHDRISMVHHEVRDKNGRIRQMGLSRTFINMILRDGKVPEEFPELYGVLSSFLVFPNITDEIRAREEMDNVPVPAYLVKSIMRKTRGDGAKNVSEKGIKRIESFMFYKSLVLRQLAINILTPIALKGRILIERLYKSILISETEHIDEDFLFIQRQMIEDPELVAEAVYNKTGERISRNEIDKIEFSWLNKGVSKNIFMATCYLKNQRTVNFVISTIRHNQIGFGYSEYEINDAVKNWQSLIAANVPGMPKIYAERWVRDFRPRMVDSSQVDDTQFFDNIEVVKNDIQIIFRDFMEGDDLEVELKKSISQDEKRDAVKTALEGYLGMWNATNMGNDGGLFIDDPKPANVVVKKTAAGYVSGLIDFDSIRRFKDLNEVRDKVAVYPEYGDFDIVERNGRAVVAEKKEREVSGPVNIAITANGSSAIESNMAMIHEINLELLPPVENGKVLYHVITEEIIPVTMRNDMANFARYTENLKLRERVRIVKRKDLKSQTASLNNDSNNIVLAAVQNREDLALLPKDVKALVFAGADGGAFGFKQLEGIMAALRALERGDAGALARLYRMLTGTAFSGNENDILKYIKDPQALASIIVFTLEPSVAKDTEDLKRLNKALIEFLYKA